MRWDLSLTCLSFNLQLLHQRRKQSDTSAKANGIKSTCDIFSVHLAEQTREKGTWWQQSIRSHILLIPGCGWINMQHRSCSKEKQLMHKKNIMQRGMFLKGNGPMQCIYGNCNCQLVTHNSFSSTYPQTKNLPNILPPLLISSSLLSNPLSVWKKAWIKNCNLAKS